MTEQPNKDSTKEVPQPEGKEIEISNAELIKEHEAMDNAFDSITPEAAETKGKVEEKLETTPAEKKEPTETKVETKVEETETDTKPEETKEDTSQPEEEKPFIERIKDRTIKRKGEDVPVLEILETFDKAGELQSFFDDYSSKKFDYYMKTQENSRDKEGWHKERDLYNQEMTVVKLENLANEIDERNLLDIKHFKNATNEDGEFIYDEPEKALRKYQEEVKTKADQYINNKNETMKVNLQNLSNFANKHGLDSEYVDKELLPLINQYMQPSIAKGQQPFKEDTFEIFYKGLNSDTLIREAVEKANKETVQKTYEEIERTKDKSTEPIQSSQETEPVETNVEFIEMDRQFDNL